MKRGLVILFIAAILPLAFIKGQTAEPTERVLIKADMILPTEEAPTVSQQPVDQSTEKILVNADIILDNAQPTTVSNPTKGKVKDGETIYKINRKGEAVLRKKFRNKNNNGVVDMSR